MFYEDSLDAGPRVPLPLRTIQYKRAQMVAELSALLRKDASTPVSTRLADELCRTAARLQTLLGAECLLVHQGEDER